MSLRVWLPLNDDLKNYGASETAVVNNGATTDNSGKIGSCYTFNGSSNYLTVDVKTSVRMSFCCWVYFTNLSDGAQLIDCRNSSGTGYQPTYINSSTIQIGNSQNGFTNLSYSFSTSKWYHIAVTNDENKARAYVNGDFIGESANGGYDFGLLNITIGSRCSKNMYFLNGKLNDVRIYDHCLSPDEVKEISKALVLYYPLNDPLLEPTTNLVTGLKAGGRTTVSGGIVTTTGEDKDTYFTINLSESIVSGTTYTLSCEASGIPEGSYWSFPMGSQSNTSLTMRIYNGYNKYTFTANSIDWGTNQLFMDDTARSGAPVTKFYNFQLEKKDHATPYTPSSRNGLVVVDNSGYNRNGDTTSSACPSLTNDTPRNLLSCHFTANTQNLNLNPSSLSTFTTGSVSWWAKITTCGSSGLLPFTGQSTSYYLAASNNWTGAFYNGNVTASGTIKYYIDGVEDSTPSGTDSKWHYYVVTGINLSTWTKLKLNNYNPNNRAYDGSNVYYSDIKFYNTILSADDITKGYHRYAAIYSNHSFATNEVQEYIGNNLVQKANNGIATKTYTGALSSYTQPNCQISLTDSGYRIYRPANKTPSADGNTMWGGLVIKPYNENNADVLFKGHTYILKWHVKGKSSNPGTDSGWSNNVGWGGGGLTPSPSNTSTNFTPSNFTGEMDCWYKWTISDDVYKVCTSSYSSFVKGQTYLSYRDFKFGFGYTDTGSLGTDLYITNIRLYDITNDNQKVKIGVNGVINGNIVEGNFNNVSMLPDGEFYTTQFIERI